MWIPLEPVSLPINIVKIILVTFVTIFKCIMFPTFQCTRVDTHVKQSSINDGIKRSWSCSHNLEATMPSKSLPNHEIESFKLIVFSVQTQCALHFENRFSKSWHKFYSCIDFLTALTLCCLLILQTGLSLMLHKFLSF